METAIFNPKGRPSNACDNSNAACWVAPSIEDAVPSKNLTKSAPSVDSKGSICMPCWARPSSRDLGSRLVSKIEPLAAAGQYDQTSSTSSALSSIISHLQSVVRHDLGRGFRAFRVDSRNLLRPVIHDPTSER